MKQFSYFITIVLIISCSENDNSKNKIEFKSKVDSTSINPRNTLSKDDINDALIISFLEKNYEKARILLNQGADINKFGTRNYTALHHIIGDKNIEALNKLISWKIKLNNHSKLLLCTDPSLMEPAKELLGDLYEKCKCPEGSEFGIECGEAKFYTWCGPPGPYVSSTNLGFSIHGKGDCLPTNQVAPRKIYGAKFYKDEKIIKEWNFKK